MRCSAPTKVEPSRAITVPCCCSDSRHTARTSRRSASTGARWDPRAPGRANGWDERFRSRVSEDTVVPALAVVQHGISAGSLSALVAADALVRTGGSVEDLGVALDWVHCHPHTTQLRSSLDLVDGRHESPGETLLSHALHVMGVTSTPQVAITDGSFRAVVDFLVDKRVVIEFDGRVKYGRPSDTPDPFGRMQSPEQVLWQEKAREDHLRELGYEVVRVTWADLQNPTALAARIRAAIERARRRDGLLTA